MAVYKSKGIVLRSIRYGEADRILDLYTQDAGMTSAIAKGIRRTKSRFGGRLEPLSCVDFVAYEGRTLDTVTQAEVLRSFHGVRENLDRLEAAGRMVSAVRALSGGDEADRRVFNLLYHALDALEARTQDTASVEASFSLKLSILAGYTPMFERCVSCEGQPEGNPERNPEGVANAPLAYFAPDLGGVLCADCRSATGDSFPLPPGTLDELANLVANPLREAAVRKGHEESVRRVVSSHVLAHAPGASSNALLLAPDRTSRPA